MLSAKKTGMTKSPVGIVSVIVLIICAISLLACIRFTFPEKLDYFFLTQKGEVVQLEGETPYEMQAAGDVCREYGVPTELMEQVISHPGRFHMIRKDNMLEIVQQNAPVSSIDGKYKLNSEKAWIYNKKAY